MTETQSRSYVATNADICLVVWVNKRKYSIYCQDNIIAFRMIRSIFIKSEYYTESPVNHVYDFGANIGLSAIFLHALNPDAHLTCVEPSHNNLVFLRKNLAANQIPSTVIDGVVSKHSAEVALHEYPQSYLSHSLHNKGTVSGSTCHNVARTRSYRFDEVVTTRRSYGIKIDIEGSEHDLVEFPEIVQHASWVVGELHYGDFMGREISEGIEDLLSKYFKLDILQTMVVDNRVNKQFRATRQSI